MNLRMIESGMEDIKSDVNRRGWFPDEKRRVDAKKVTSALT